MLRILGKCIADVENWSIGRTGVLFTAPQQIHTRQKSHNQNIHKVQKNSGKSKINILSSVGLGLILHYRMLSFMIPGFVRLVFRFYEKHKSCSNRCISLIDECTNFKVQLLSLGLALCFQFKCIHSAESAHLCFKILFI